MALRPGVGPVAVTEPVPTWLANWRAANGVSVEDQPTQATTPAPVLRTAPTVRVDHQGFVEPRPWPYDGCLRREPVLDHDVTPPRVVRRVGWQRCMRCRRPFWSDDVVRLRLCVSGGAGCRHLEDRHAGGR